MNTLFTFNPNTLKTAALAAAVLAVSLHPSHAGPKVIPVVNGMFSTGQWYFEGERSSLAGNANLTVVPALQFSNSFSVIPVFQTNYRGTRSAEELAGGNTLFQDTWENAVSVKGVHSLGSHWRIRERAGVRSKWFRETTDETWSKGLYDYQVYTVGTEAEYNFSRKSSAALGYDFSLLNFPNYNSLESGQTSDLAREFAGEDVLDTQIHMLTTRVKMPLPFKTSSRFQGFYSPRNYTDQHVVVNTGLYSAAKREDTYSGGSLSLERFFKGPKTSHFLAGLSYGYTAFDSNQNHYDANQTFFVANFYDYSEQTVGGNLSYAFAAKENGPMVAEVGGSYAHRDYSNRVIQDTAGVYMSEKLNIVTTSLNLAFSYPLAKFVRLRVASTFGQSKSNNDYEELYRYNYNTANYQFGFIYEY